MLRRVARPSPEVLALAAALVLGLAAAPAAAEEPPHRPITAGAEVDLVPIGITVATRDSGFAAGLWVGRWKDRLRFTTSIVHEPEATRSYAASPETGAGPRFRRYEAIRVGMLYERYLRTEFQGAWAGAGVEVGWVSLGSASELQRANQTNPGAVIALGYTQPLWGGLYLSPSAAGHAAFTRSVVLEGERRREHPLWGVLSVSLGWAQRFP